MRKRLLLRAVVVLALLVAPFASNGGAEKTKKRRRHSVTVRRIGPGTYHKKIVRPERKQVIHMITVRLKARSTVDVALAGNQLGHIDLLSKLAPRNGAFAAINGDFGTRERRPWNMYAQDGDLVQTERTWGRALSVTALEDESFIGHPKPRVVLVPKGGDQIPIKRVNGAQPSEKEVVLYTRAGRRVESPPKRACAARLKPRDSATFGASGSITQRFTVVASRCRNEKMPLYKGIVVATRRTGTRAAKVAALTKGQVAKLKWSIQLSDAADIIGGNPIIVRDGKILWGQVRNCGYLCERHPRTGVGITGDNKLLMVVVDGRRPVARGMFLYELAKFFVNNGAVRAMTMDGGGASEMWIRGKVVNQPSDGTERPLVNALIVLPGKDHDQSHLTAQTTMQHESTSLDDYVPSLSLSQERAFEAAASDPGSLGGLADYLQRRGTRIPRWMETIARDLGETSP